MEEGMRKTCIDAATHILTCKRVSCKEVERLFGYHGVWVFQKLLDERALVPILGMYLKNKDEIKIFIQNLRENEY